MNIYNYLKRTIKDQDETNSKILKNKQWILFWMFFNLILGLVFSCLFISYFTILSRYIYNVNHHIWTNHAYLDEMVKLNQSLLVGFIVIWVIYIVSELWLVYWYNKVKLFNISNYKKANTIMNVFSLLSLFAPFICFCIIYNIYFIFKRFNL